MNLTINKPCYTYTFTRNVCVMCFLVLLSTVFSSAQTNKSSNNIELNGSRFLTLNTMIRVKLIEYTRKEFEGPDLSDKNTPERVIAFREAVEAGFPGSKIT